MKIDELKNYMAKTKPVRKSIYEHNKELEQIASQIKYIYDLSEKEFDILLKVITYHDVGKAHSNFQENPSEAYKILRHEILSASTKELTEVEKIAVLLHHKSIEKICEFLHRIQYKDYIDELSCKLDIEKEDIMPLIEKIAILANTQRDTLLKSVELINLKGYLQYCDHVASAGVQTLDIGLNGRKSFPYAPNSIQEKVLELETKEDILINAMTGLGKTAAAFYWTDLIQNHSRSRRIFYLLPYTASINSLYKDFNKRDISVGILHGKASYFLKKEFDALEEEERNRVGDYKQIYNLFKKSIKQVTICTIFQIVKALFSCNGFEMLLAQMNNSIFIVDEVHCFDIKQLMLIIETLKYLKQNFNINICIMSASIPKSLKDFIEAQIGIKKVITADKEDFISRHHINYVDELLNQDKFIKKIEKDQENNKKVLICVNKVDTAQNLFDHFEKKYKVNMIHGCFNAEDREAAEKKLKDNSINILIGTQAIEVSLDISYDTMYTELAPFDDLIQRFGRVNRKGTLTDNKGNRVLAEIYIFENTSKNIYEQGILERTASVLQTIIENDNGIILEEKVTQYLDIVYPEFDIESYNKEATKMKKRISRLTVGKYLDVELDEFAIKDRVNVLPLCLTERYKKYIDEKDYFSANSLLVNVMYNSKMIQQDKELDVYIHKGKYSSKKGLEQFNEENQ